jgi:Putative restriction endonuclease
MTQKEFHRRYEQQPDHVKAELIGGVVYVASPLRRPHGARHPQLSGVLWLYESATPGVELLDNATTILGPESEPQPDLSLRILPEWGGRSETTPDEYVSGGPELLAEVSDSTVKLDLEKRPEDYRRAGVCEYIVLAIKKSELYWFDFRRGVQLRPSKGIYRSRVFPGLWIDGAALLNRDKARLIAVVQEGIASSAHATFVKRLQASWRKRNARPSK